MQSQADLELVPATGLGRRVVRHRRQLWLEVSPSPGEQGGFFVPQ